MLYKNKYIFTRYKRDYSSGQFKFKQYYLTTTDVIKKLKLNEMQMFKIH